MASLPAGGGTPKEALKIDFGKGERLHRYPCALPDSNAVLLTIGIAESETFDDARIVAFSPETGEKRTLVEGGTHPRYSPSRHLLYARDGKIFAIRFDAKRLKTSGHPFPAVEGVMMSRNSGLANYNSRLAAIWPISPEFAIRARERWCGSNETGRQKQSRRCRRGRICVHGSHRMPNGSPSKIEGPNHNLYVYDFERGVLATLTTDGVSHWPVWSPDGSELAFRSGPMAGFKMWRVPADRSRAPQQVPATGVSQSAESWSPDGRELAYTTGAPGVTPNIMVAALEGGSRHTPVASYQVCPGITQVLARWPLVGVLLQ